MRATLPVVLAVLFVPPCANPMPAVANGIMPRAIAAKFGALDPGRGHQGIWIQSNLLVVLSDAATKPLSICLVTTPRKPKPTTKVSANAANMLH